jgi:hypothetical protein
MFSNTPYVCDKKLCCPANGETNKSFATIMGCQITKVTNEWLEHKGLLSNQWVKYILCPSNFLLAILTVVINHHAL